MMFALEEEPTPVTTWVVSSVPVHGRLPSFELTDERGEPFGSRQLRGGIYLLQFTSSAEPLLARATRDRLAVLQAHLAAAGVTASLLAVDTAIPTQAHRERLEDTREAAAARWYVLRGAVAPLLEQVLALVPPELGREQATNEPVWARYTVLVDQSGAVRGFFDREGDTHVLNKLVEDVRCVRECGPVPAVAGAMPGTRIEGASCGTEQRWAKP
jgi:hypothetical protein